MKLGLVFGSVIFLIAGITLADSSLEVSGQSDMERQKILEAASNAAANATADAMIKAENVLSVLNATNVTELDPNPSPSPDLSTDNFPNPDPDEGTGYYPPPYTYEQCLGVFNKEMCDFRFNR